MRRVPLANQPGWDGSRSSTSGRREQIGIRAFVVNQLVVIMGLFIGLVLLDLINILALTHASAHVAGKLFCASRSRAPIPWFSPAYPLQMPRKKNRRADSNRLPLLQLRVIGHALQGCAGDRKGTANSPVEYHIAV